MAIGLNDLRRHLLSQSKVEPLHVVPPPEKPAALESLDDRRYATEPQIYSVRKLLQNVSPDLEPVEQPAAVANESTEHVSGAPDGAISDDASSPTGLSDAVLSYVEKTGARDYQVFHAVAKVFEQTRGARDQLDQWAMMYEPIEALGQAVAAACGPLEPAEELRLRLVQLAEAFEPVTTLQEKFRPLLDSLAAPRAGSPAHPAPV